MLYYFDKNGNRITDLTSRYTGPYTVQVDRTNGVMTDFCRFGQNNSGEDNPCISRITWHTDAYRKIYAEQKFKMAAV